MKTKILILLLALAPMMTQAQFTFTTNSGAITINGYNPAAGLNVVIPAGTNGYPVTSIGDEAFYNCFNLTSVTIPSSVTSANPIWTPIQTNTLTNGSFYFSEPLQTNLSGRFYRISLP